MGPTNQCDDPAFLQGYLDPHRWQGDRGTCPRTVVHQTIPSMAEQVGADPTSKLAAAIHDLADATIKQIIYVVAIVILAIYLIRAFLPMAGLG